MDCWPVQGCIRLWYHPETLLRLAGEYRTAMAPSAYTSSVIPWEFNTYQMCTISLETIKKSLLFAFNVSTSVVAEVK